MLFMKKPDDSISYPVLGESPAPASLPATGQVPAAASTQSGTATQSVIDAWLNINGNLQSEGDVRVDGHICGDIRCAHLVVGREATVVGHIVAEEAVVRGRVKGSIRANRVILQDTACVESDIIHKLLSVDEGAAFDGLSCHRSDPFQDQEAPSPVKAAKKRKPGLEPGDVNGASATSEGLSTPEA